VAWLRIAQMSDCRSIEIKLLRHQKKLVKKLVRAGPRAGRPLPEAPGPTYLFKNNNKNFTTFLLLLVSLVVRGGGGIPASVCLLKEKGARKFTLNYKNIPIFLRNILILRCFLSVEQLFFDARPGRNSNKSWYFISMDLSDCE
jgi:hypothetical protein